MAVAANHRAQPTLCPRSMGNGLVYPPCTTDADCKMADGFGSMLTGKCTADDGGLACDFNQCSSDSSCTNAADVCSCQGQTGGDGRLASACIAANCHTDADCGPGGSCSPTVDFGCGVHFGTIGYYCHTCADTCVNDSDCPPDPTKGPGNYCAYDPGVGRWACGYGACTG
jgi:hypothetical protein